MREIDPKSMTPKEIRHLIRKKEWNKSTSGVANGYVQANLVILKKDNALAFMQYCQRNPKACPLLDVTEVGSSKPYLLAEDSDLKTDIPKYRVYRKGELTEVVEDLHEIWEEDMVGFLLGCSLTFERALVNMGIQLSHFENNTAVSMYKTNIPTVKAGIFEGPMVVSMRPILIKDLVKATTITAKYPHAHGAPIHIGSPELIGIKDINKPDYGEAVPIPSGYVPVFWACGVTPQAAAMESKVDIMITHEPGHMFVSDKKENDQSFY